MDHPNLYWLQSVPAAFFLAIIGPILMPERLAYSIIIVMGIFGLIGSAGTFVHQSLRSTMPLAGVPEMIGIIVNLAVISLGVHLAFGPGAAEFLFNAIGYVADHPHYLVILGGAVAATMLALQNARDEWDER